MSAPIPDTGQLIDGRRCGGSTGPHTSWNRSGFPG